MQRSSPLAAMQPAHVPFNGWGCRTNLFAPSPQSMHTLLPSPRPSFSRPSDRWSSRANGGSSTMTTTANFNFRDISMDESGDDYFNHHPIRGSSPTASLAADLSTNFHIDQRSDSQLSFITNSSPQVSTPRRSLFSSNVLGTWDTQVPKTLITPPISSSPPPCPGLMEISPLPHKPAFVVESASLEPPTSDMGIAFEAPRLEERRPLLKPSFSRLRGVTSQKPECPPFMFGSAGLSISASPSLDLGECIEMLSSEKEEALNAVDPSMGPPRYRPSSFNLKTMAAPNGGHVRKSSNPFQRPRKQFRRSQSMYQHPDELMRQEAPPPMPPSQGMDPIMDLDDPPKLRLPHFHANNGESLPRISKETMVDVLDGRYNDTFDSSLVVDCRFEYEFNGGHIDGAVNFNDKEQLARSMFAELDPSKSSLVILHCEYSAHRAPLMAKHLRNEDRRQNAHRYPQLSFPEVYILDGGYSAFYANHKMRCSPQNYITMSDEKHENACELGMGRVKKQQRAKLGRAQTFAFGQQDRLEDSPTAAAAATKDCGGMLTGNLDMSTMLDSPLASLRAASRRLATF